MKRKFLILGIVMSGLTCAQDNSTKAKYDVNGTDLRAYKISQDNYDKWRKIYGGPDIRYIGAKENNSILEAYLKCKEEKCLDFDVITYKEVLFNY